MASTTIRKKKNLSYDRLSATDVDIAPVINVDKMSQSDVPWIVPQRAKSLNLSVTDRALSDNKKMLNFTSVPIVVFNQVIIALNGKFLKNVQIEVRFLQFLSFMLILSLVSIVMIHHMPNLRLLLIKVYT